MEGCDIWGLARRVESERRRLSGLRWPKNGAVGVWGVSLLTGSLKAAGIAAGSWAERIMVPCSFNAILFGFIKVTNN